MCDPATADILLQLAVATGEFGVGTRPQLRRGTSLLQREGAPSMCDYSLHGIASRPAEVGDHLITTKFPGTCTRGFCAAGKPKVAVCLLPGTELAFKSEAMRQGLLGRLLPRFGKLGGTVARFRQINKGEPNRHHDALEFANGTIVLLTHLRAGQLVTVLQLPPQSPAPKEATEGEQLVPAL
jgi:hypothetical protein